MEKKKRFFDWFYSPSTYNVTAPKEEVDAGILQFIQQTANGRKPLVNNLSITAVYTAIDILSQTLAKLPLELLRTDKDGSKLKYKENSLYPLLHLQPNNYTNSYQFISTLETHRNLHGNAYAYINRNKGTGKVTGFQIISPSLVKSYEIVNGELYYMVELERGKSPAPIHCSDLLHFKALSTDGIMGVSKITAIKNNMEITHEGYQTIKNHYKNNLASNKVLKSEVSINNYEKLESLISDFKTKYSGSNGDLILPLPPNTDLIDLKLPFEDAKFIDTIKFNNLQIGAIYGVPSFFFNDLDYSKFNSLEQMTLMFKSNTIQAIAKQYRQEMESKLLSLNERLDGVSIEFNLTSMIETDIRSKTEYYQKLIQSGVMTPNKAAQMEQLETYPEGEKHMIPSNMMYADVYAAKTNKNNNEINNE